VDFWYVRISLRAKVPGLYRRLFFWGNGSPAVHLLVNLPYSTRFYLPSSGLAPIHNIDFPIEESTKLTSNSTCTTSLFRRRPFPRRSSLRSLGLGRSTSRSRAFSWRGVSPQCDLLFLLHSLRHCGDSFCI
jgi:hypothetical protein